MGAILSAFGSGGALLRPTGTAAGDAALITANLTTPLANTYGGTVDMAAGTWNLAAGALAAITRSGIYLRWQPGAEIIGTGTGDLIRMYDSSVYGSGRLVNGGGILGSPWFNITAMGAGSSAVHAGDILGLQMYANVYNTGGNAGQHGIHLDNNYFWTEQCEADIRATGCDVALDNSANPNSTATGSFDRLNLKLWTQNANISNGLSLLNNVAAPFVYDGTFDIRGNYGASSNSTVYYVISFAGTSSIHNSRVDIGVEYDSGAGTAPSTILFTGSPFNTMQDCWGWMNFGASAAFTAAPHNSGNLRYFGTISGDNTLVPAGPYKTPPQTVNITANGQTIFITVFPVTYLTGATATGLILQGGAYDGQEVILANTGAGTFTFAVPGTSNVAGGTNVVLGASTTATSTGRFIWDNTAALWFLQ